MFGNLEALPPDPILGVTAAFRRDADPGKVDLGVGVYRDEDGITPVPAAVREAERELIAGQTTKTYVGPAGNVEFNERIVELALGALATQFKDRTATIQTVGGCGALRMAGNAMVARMPMMATTMISSMRVKPLAAGVSRTMAHQSLYLVPSRATPSDWV